MVSLPGPRLIDPTSGQIIVVDHNGTEFTFVGTSKAALELPDVPPAVEAGASAGSDSSE